MNEYQLVRLLCREVPGNQQTNGNLCPWCRGGRHGEKSLSIFTRHDGISLYLCHRASCGKAGRVLPNGNINSNHEKPLPTFHPRPFTGDTRQLSPEERELLSELYGLTQREITWHRLSLTKDTFNSNDFNRLVIPIQGPSNQLRGHITSLLPNQKSDGPKVSPYKVLDEPFVGWFWSESSRQDRIVICEDAISAIRVARHYFAVCLLGTNLNVDDMFEILKHSDNVVLALDKDATGRALEYQQRFRFIAPNLQVAMLDKDFKSCQDPEILEKVG